jgi:hypothetical protein
MTDYTDEEIWAAAELYPSLWVFKHKIKNEVGNVLDFKKRKFLVDIYDDFSPLQALLKPPQIGATVMNTLKALYVAKKFKRQIIYTLPTQGDVQDMVGGSFNRIIAQNPILLDWVKDKDTIEQKSVGDSMIFYRGCVDEETEVLTENGWCKVGQVNKGDRLPTLNMATNSVEMDTVLDLSIFREKKQMVRIKSRQVDQLVTADHRCVVAKRTFKGDKSPLRIVRAHELVGKTAAYIPMVHHSVFDYTGKGDAAFYKILGWVIGDGSYWTKRDKYTNKKGKNKTAISEKICIIQSKFCKELEADLTSAKIGYYKKKHGKNCFRYELNAEASVAIRKLIPTKELTYDLVFNAVHAERSALLQGLMMSDGNNSEGTSFYQNQGLTTDAFQALLVLLGRTTTQHRTRKNVTVTIKQSDYAHVKAKYVPYNGIAWCPTTNNGTIFIRRNGVVSVTGQTFTSKQAMMIPSGLNIHDEVDASDPDVITQYETRLQGQEDGGWRWYFSHPSLSGHGIDIYWQQSDQKEWHITCPSCKKEQILTWPDSIDPERKCYQCKYCKEELQTEDRINGRWKNKYDVPWNGEPLKGTFSGWHVSQLMLYNKTAEDILNAYNDPNKTKQYFYNYVLGLPYIDSNDRIDPLVVLRNCEDNVNPQTSRVVIGADTGHGIHYSLMNSEGVFYYEHATLQKYKDPYDRIEEHLKNFKQSIAVFDQGGDLIGVRKLQQKYPGRVFLCWYRKDRKSVDMITWGKGHEYGKVIVDRNRLITLIVEQLNDTGRFVLNGTPEDWKEWADHFGNIYREQVKTKDIKDKDDRTLYGPDYVWKRNGPDHFVHTLVYCYVGMQKYGGGEQATVVSESLNLPSSIEAHEGNYIPPSAILTHQWEPD